MKTLSKLSTAAMAAAFLMLNLSSCTKDASQAPSAKTPSLDDAKSLAAAELCNKGHKPPPPPKCICKIDSSGFGVVTTLAGNNNQGRVNGTGAGAYFTGPYEIAADAAGNVYVSETQDNAIRVVSPAGVVTTYAGSNNIAGHTNGPRLTATFSFDYESGGSLAVGPDGSVYVSDYVNRLIRKISPAGIVSTIAGNGVAGVANGAAIGPTVDNPTAIAVDKNNIVYFVDGSNLLRKLTPDGTITTLAGHTGSGASVDATGTAAYFQDIYSLAIDAEGNIYALDGEYREYIRKITPAGVVTTYAGYNLTPSSTIHGTPIQIALSGAESLAFDSKGDLFIGNYNEILEISVTGVVSVVAGNPASPVAYEDGKGSAATFSLIYGITMDKNDNLYVADYYNRRIRKVVVKVPPCTMTAPTPVAKVTPATSTSTTK